MDKKTPRPKMVAFFANDPNASEHSYWAPTYDVLCALTAVTATLEGGIGELDIERMQGLATASRIFSGMLSDRYTDEEVPVPRPRRRRKLRSGNVVELVRGGHAEVDQDEEVQNGRTG